MTNDNDLRTALTKLADEIESREHPAIVYAVVDRFVALLAAHPAEVVSDTRREDVARGMYELNCRRYGWSNPLDWAEVHESRREEYLGYADVALAVLPAPPVADEAEIGVLLRSHHAAPADALEARIGMRNGCTCGGPGLAVNHQAAAVAAHLRGATRG